MALDFAEAMSLYPGLGLLLVVRKVWLGFVGFVVATPYGTYGTIV